MMNQRNAAIAVSNLRKRFSDKEVLKGVNFSVPHGVIYALLGSNGAGKTTTVRILTTQIKPDSGKVTVGGYDVCQNPQKVHKNISLTGQFASVDEALTGKENLILMGKLYHIPNPGQKAAKLLEEFGLSLSENKPAASYSGGMKRKLDIAMSLMGNPQILFLDEPTTGLDPQSRRSMWKIIRDLKKSGVTIFLTTQYLEEAEQLADTIAILDKGTMIAEGSSSYLKSLLPQGAVRFVFPDKENFLTARKLLEDFKTSSVSDERRITVFTDGQTDTLSQIFCRFHLNKVTVLDFSMLIPNLEDVFLTLIEKNGRESYGNASEKIL